MRIEIEYKAIDILFVSNCRFDLKKEKDIPDIVNKMEEAYSRINTLQYSEERSSESVSDSTRTFYIDKQQQKMKIVATGGTLNEGEIFTQLWVGNEYYTF